MELTHQKHARIHSLWGILMSENYLCKNFGVKRAFAYIILSGAYGNL